MKAILVIELDDGLDTDKYEADVYLTKKADTVKQEYRRYVMQYPEVPLKPMPQKMRTDEDDIEEDSYYQGWNDCLEELEK